MGRDQGPFKLDNPWPRIGWWSAAAMVGTFFVLGFVVLGRYQENGPTLDTWSAICRAIGLTADSGPAGEPQPPLRTPTRIAWTGATLARVASGSEQSGAFVALNCRACHGERGVSPSTLIPTPRRNGFGGNLQTARRLSLTQAPLGRYERDRYRPDRSGLG